MVPLRSAKAITGQPISVNAFCHGDVDPPAGEEDYKNYDEADAEPLHECHFFGIKHGCGSSGIEPKIGSAKFVSGAAF